MKYAREKRLLVGWLALLLPVPLPLNQVLEWPALFAYSAFIVYFLQRAEDGRPIILSNTVLNVLGFLYLPVLAVDLQQSLLRNQVVRALLHLLLFLLVVKLYSMKQEGETWHVLSAIFFLFVAAMATSSHVTVVLYLVAATALGLYALARLAHLSMLAASARDSGERRRTQDAVTVRAAPLPRGRWASWVIIALVIAVAIPVFAAMPRLRKPWVLGRGGGQIGLARTTGFSDQVNLSSLTSGIRVSSEVVLRIRIDQGPVPGTGDLRLKGASFETYDGATNLWSRPYRDFRERPVDGEGVVWIARDGARDRSSEVAGRWHFSLEPLDSPSLLLPMTAIAVDPGGRVRSLALGPGGDLAHRMLTQRSDAVDYEVLLGELQLIAADLAGGLDAEAASPRMRELARQVMGEGTRQERAARLERWLINEISYTTDFAGREGREPIEEFLFVHRSGHCELFATSMVLMLRAEGIPARLVTGFLGAELNNLEDLLVVRQSNAHAWVEAETETGWQVFDPTPPSGRPSSPERGLRLLLQQVYDFVAYRFDRYVLTYGSDDQKSFFESLKERLAKLWQGIWPGEPDASPLPAGESPLVTVPAQPPAAAMPLWATLRTRVGGLLLFALGVVAVWLWRRRPLHAEEAYQRLRKTMEESGLGVDDTTAPLELRRRLALEVPEAADHGGRLVDLYVAASFAGVVLDRDTRAQLRGLLTAAVRRVGEVARERRRSARAQGRGSARRRAQATRS